MNAAYDTFIAARDFLLAHRTDYATAVRDFGWPELSQFNWALDYFDVMARGNEEPLRPRLQDDGLETAHFRHRHAAAERRQAVVAAALVVQRRVRAFVGFESGTGAAGARRSFHSPKSAVSAARMISSTKGMISGMAMSARVTVRRMRNSAGKRSPRR